MYDKVPQKLIQSHSPHLRINQLTFLQMHLESPILKTMWSSFTFVNPSPSNSNLPLCCHYKPLSSSHKAKISCRQPHCIPKHLSHNHLNTLPVVLLNSLHKIFLLMHALVWSLVSPVQPVWWVLIVWLRGGSPLTTILLSGIDSWRQVTWHLTISTNCQFVCHLTRHRNQQLRMKFSVCYVGDQRHASPPNCKVFTPTIRVSNNLGETPYTIGVLTIEYQSKCFKPNYKAYCLKVPSVLTFYVHYVSSFIQAQR